MLGMEEILCELTGEDINEQGLPPGFRFHPTDEELITFYLASKVFNRSFCGVEIAEVDLNRCEPWELPEVAKMGEREWYFFSLRDRKYPTGLRTNRATGGGYWKATGKDREVYSSSSSSSSCAYSNSSRTTGSLLGMKKTLVFYKGRAPRGQKTKWVMHEYRLDGHFSLRHTSMEEWVICRIYHKIGEKKNIGVLQGQNYYYNEKLLEVSSPPTTPGGGYINPLLLETETTPVVLLESQNPMRYSVDPNSFLLDQQHIKTNLLMSLINPVVSQPNPFPIINGGFQPSSFTSSTPNNTTINKDDTSPSILFKSLLSHHQQEEYYYYYTTLKQEQRPLLPSSPIQSNTEAAHVSHFLLSDDDHKIDPGIFYHQTNHPLLFGLGDCRSITGDGFPSSAAGSSGANTVHEIPTSVAFNQAGFQMLAHPSIKDTSTVDFN